MRLLRRFLGLAAIQPIPSGMTPAGASDFSLMALMQNVNAYSEEYVSVTTAGTNTTLTAAQLLAKNVLLATGASGDFTLTLPTTARIIDALGPTLPRNGAFYFPLYVANNTTHVATLTAGDASTTFSGSALMAAMVTGKWMVHVVAPTNAQGAFTLVIQRILSSGSGASAAAGSDTEIQYNNSGAFGADSGLTYTSATKTLNLVGSANTLSLAGSAAAAATTLAATGTDTDIGIQLQPKGAGVFSVKKAEGVFTNYINASGTVLSSLRILGAATEASIGLGLNALAAAGSNVGAIGIGMSALLNLTSGIGNIGIGKLALTSVTTAANNTAVGYQAVRSATSASNTGIGAFALEFLTTGAQNTAIGQAAANGISTAANNTAIGYGALFTGGGDDNVAIGHSAMTTAGTTAAGNVAIGKSALILITSGADNTAIGFQSGAALTTGSNNIAIGTNSMPAVTTGSNNITIGASATVGSGSRTKAVAIGSSATAGADNACVIGASGGSNELSVGINMTTPTARLHLPAGTATAGTAPLKLTSGTNLSVVENGAFEYDGANLYFTTGGSRKTVTLV